MRRDAMQCDAPFLQSVTVIALRARPSVSAVSWLAWVGVAYLKKYDGLTMLGPTCAGYNRPAVGIGLRGIRGARPGELLPESTDDGTVSSGLTAWCGWNWEKGKTTSRVALVQAGRC